MITSLKLQNFRSYTELDIEFKKNLVVIVGPNAVGKTNLLESIFVLSTTKSFRSPDTELIQYTKPFYKLQAIFLDDVIDLHYTTLLSNKAGSQKVAKLNNKKHSLSSLVGVNPVVLFEPNDMNLLSGPPSQRRRYLDIVLSQTNNRYLLNLRNYKRIIAQRNSLLLHAKRQGKNNINDHLFVYDVQLVEPASYITQTRQKFIEVISKSLQKYYLLLASDNKLPVITDLPSLNLRNNVLNQYSQSHEADKVSTHTLIGPHRDDFKIELINNNKQPVTPSRGETRSTLLALKLAELDYINKTLNKEPILLLDDVFSELDVDRRKHLMEAINKHQTFITTTELPPNKLLDFELIDLSGVNK